MLTVAERSAILETAISRYVKQGYIVQTRSDVSAQLIKKKRLSVFWALVYTVLFVAPLFIYLLWYLMAKDKAVYLFVDESGRVQAQ